MNVVRTAEADPAELLLRIRLQAGISQAQLAARAGTTQSSISALESGRSSPSVSTMARLLTLMGHRLELAAPACEAGIDRTILQRNLTLRPDERVRHGLAHSDFVRRNRGAART